MNGVLGHLHEAMSRGEEDFVYEHPELDLSGEIAALHASLETLDRLLATQDDWRVKPSTASCRDRWPTR